MSVEKYLLRLYPQAWRQRYEDELLAMLEENSLSFADGINLVFGALDAQLHPHLGVTGIALSERMIRMIQTLRNSLLLIFCAYVGFCVAGVGFQKLTEYDDFMEAARTYSVIGLSFNLVVIGAIIALLAVLLGALPIAGAIVRSAFAQRRFSSLFLLAAPLLAFLVFLGVTFLLEAIDHPGTHAAFLPRGLFLGTFLAAVIVSVVALCMAVVRSDVPEKLLHLAILPSVLVTIAMALMLAATIVWGLSLRNDVPLLFNSNEGIFGSSTALSWLHNVVIMALATALAIVALIRSFSARTALRTPVA